MLRIAGETDCHGPKGPRNDVFFVFAYVRLYGKCPIFHVFASQCAHWRGNPFLSSRRLLSPPGGDKFIKPTARQTAI